MKMKNRILVIGEGFLGTYITLELKKQGFTTFSTRLNHPNESLRLDIREIKSIKNSFLKTQPNIVFNCAALTDLDYLEKNHDVAFAVNSEGAKNIALICNEKNTRLIHISTDGLFDGKNGSYKENDIPNPINVYGKSKLKGEKLVKQNLENFLIIRTNFFGYDERRKNLFTWIYSSLNQGKTINGFNDIIFNPLEISNLCRLIIEASMIPEKGILHLSGNEIISKYEFALKIANTFNLNRNLINKGSLNDIDLTASRPLNTSLSNEKANKLLKTKISSINNSLILIRNRMDENQ